MAAGLIWRADSRCRRRWRHCPNHIPPPPLFPLFPSLSLSFSLFLSLSVSNCKRRVGTLSDARWRSSRYMTHYEPPMRQSKRRQLSFEESSKESFGNRRRGRDRKMKQFFLFLIYYHFFFLRVVLLLLLLLLLFKSLKNFKELASFILYLVCIFISFFF